MAKMGKKHQDTKSITPHLHKCPKILDDRRNKIILWYFNICVDFTEKVTSHFGFQNSNNNWHDTSCQVKQTTPPLLFLSRHLAFKYVVGVKALVLKHAFLSGFLESISYQILLPIALLFQQYGCNCKYVPNSSFQLHMLLIHKANF